MKLLIKISALSLMFSAIFLQVSAQEKFDLKSELPFDETIKTGQLENGLKYFIKNNGKPENRVQLRLVINAGSVLEDEDQLGLAHFTEHMAFNGSEHFEKNELVDYLQSVGVKFGAHLNAYTSFDETVYILPLPSDDKEILEKGITILEDWAGHLSFDAAELEKERGVVVEEWRLGQGASMRMLQDYLPVIFKGSKYAERLPIGKKETLENFELSAITRFYQDWYRPDLMAVIAVGDIDVEEMEEMIKAHFKGLKNPNDRRERMEAEVPDNVEPLVAVTSDKEATNTIFSLTYKSDVTQMKTGTDYRQGLVEYLFTAMINQRLSELLQEANPPYLYASTSIGSFITRNKGAFSCFAVPKPDDVKGGIATLMKEIRRVELHGFNGSEMKTAKLNLMEGYKSAYKEKENTESAALTDELVNHFLEQEPVPGIEFEYQFVVDYLEGISLTEVNAIISDQIKKENRVMYLTAPEQEGVALPSTEDLLAWVAQSENLDVEALAEEEISTTLIANEPKGGEVTQKEEVRELAATKLKLSNGAVVYLKKTDFKNDEILFSAKRKGGISLASDDDYWSASFASSIVALSGVGEFSYIKLQKALAGKSVGVSPYIGDLNHGFRGSSSPEALETMLQLVHLYFNEVRMDQSAFQSLIQRNTSFLANAMSDPNYYFQDKSARFLSQGHLRGGGIPTLEDLDKIDHIRAIEFFRTLFSSPGDFEYWLVGNFNEKEVVALLEKYIGGSATRAAEGEWKDHGMRPPEGDVIKVIKKGTEPKSKVNMIFTGEFEYSREEGYYLRCLGEVMSIQLIEILREEKSGVYGVGASGTGTKSPYPHYSFNISFPCGPENVDELSEAALGVLEDIKSNGVSEENLNKIKEAQKRDMELNWKENSYWLSVLKSFHANEEDQAYIEWLNDRVDQLQADDLKRVAIAYLNRSALITIQQQPEDSALEDE